MTLGDHSDEKRMEEEIAERLEEHEWTSSELEEHVYQEYRSMSEADLVAEMEAMEARYGRLDPAYEAAFKRILREKQRRDSAEVDP